MELSLKELAVFFLGDIRLILGPQWLHGIKSTNLGLLNLLSALNFLALFISRSFLCFKVHLDRVTDIIGILLNQILDVPIVSEVFLSAIAVEILAQGNGNGGTAGFLFAFLHGVRAITSGFPTNSLLLPGLAGYYSNLLCHHKCGIEAHTELTNEIITDISIASIFLFLLKLLQKCLGA